MGEWRYSTTILDLGTRWRWTVSFTPLSLYPRERNPRYPLDRRLCVPQKNLTPAGNRTPVFQLVAIPIELSLLHLHIDNFIIYFPPPNLYCVMRIYKHNCERYTKLTLRLRTITTIHPYGCVLLLHVSEKLWKCELWAPFSISPPPPNRRSCHQYCLHVTCFSTKGERGHAYRSGTVIISIFVPSSRKLCYK
jgi:hypothetical protein